MIPKQKMGEIPEQTLRLYQQITKRFQTFQSKYTNKMCTIYQAFELISEKQYEDYLNLQGPTYIHYLWTIDSGLHGSEHSITNREAKLLFSYANLKYFCFLHDKFKPHLLNDLKIKWVKQFIQTPFHINPQQKYKMNRFNVLIQLIFHELFKPSLFDFQPAEKFIFSTIQKGHIHALLIINSILISRDSIIKCQKKEEEIINFYSKAIIIVTKFLSKLQKTDQIIQMYHCFRCMQSLWKMLLFQHYTYCLLDKESYDNWISSVKMFIRIKIQYNIQQPYLQELKLYQEMAKLTIIRSLTHFLRKTDFEVLKRNQKSFSSSIPMILSLGMPLVQQLQRQNSAEIKVEVLKFILAIIDKQFIYNMNKPEQIYIFRILSNYYATDPSLQKQQFIYSKAGIDLKKQNGNYAQEDLRFMVATATRQMFLHVKDRLMGSYAYDFPSQGLITQLFSYLQRQSKQSESERILYAISILDFSKFKLQITSKQTEIYDQLSSYINGQSIMNKNSALIVLHKIISTTPLLQRKAQMQRIIQDCSKCLKEGQTMYIRTNASIIFMMLCQKGKCQYGFKLKLFSATQIMLTQSQNIPRYEVPELIINVINIQPFRQTLFQICDQMLQLGFKFLKSLITLTKWNINNDVDGNRYKDIFNKLAQIIAIILSNVGKDLPKKLFTSSRPFVINILGQIIQSLTSPWVHDYLKQFKPALIRILYHHISLDVNDKKYLKKILCFIMAYFEWPRDPFELNQTLYLVLKLGTNDKSFWDQTNLYNFFKVLLKNVEKPQTLNQQIFFNIFRAFTIINVTSKFITQKPEAFLAQTVLQKHVFERIIEKNYDTNSAVSFGFLVCCAIAYHLQLLIEFFQEQAISKTNIFLYFKGIFQMFAKSIKEKYEKLPQKIVNYYVRGAIKIYKWAKQQIIQNLEKISLQQFSKYLQILIFIIHKSYLLQQKKSTMILQNKMIDEGQQINQMKQENANLQMAVQAPQTSQNQWDFLAFYNVDMHAGGKFIKNTFQVAYNWLLIISINPQSMSLIKQNSFYFFQCLQSLHKRFKGKQEYLIDQKLLQLELFK